MSSFQRLGWNAQMQPWDPDSEPDTFGISGAGGGGKAAKAHTPTEAPNTLQSVVKGRILDLIAYGPIYGLVDGLKSVYLDKTPVMNADGSVNFSGCKLTTREGYPTQTPIEGFPSIESSSEINTDVLFATPVVRSISNNDADAALVTLQLAGLSQQIANGDVTGYSVGVAIDVRIGAGAWNNAVTETITGKTTSPFPVTYRVPLVGAGPYSLRVRRLAAESTVGTKVDKVTWTLLTEVIDKRLSYPNMALVGLEIDSKLFGSSLPERSYDMKLSIINVPSNYDPITRVYTGIWNGTFKQAWSDNPAWCYYDLATHPVIGAGLTNVDKWIIYNIGKYCDQLVPDGYGGMEPRFTCNTIFAAEEDAINALNTLASCFRGMAYWGTNTMVAVADMPTTPKKIVSPANVIDGDFEYTGTSLRERHSVAVAMWNDPADEGKAIPEVYEDPISINMYGWKETRVTAVACNSRGQALRLCKWILYSERMETQTINYKATLDQADLRPGDIIEVADPFAQGARMGGRVITPGTKTIVLDAIPDASIRALSANWFLSIVMADGTVQRMAVSSFTANGVILTGTLASLPIVGAMWALSATALQLPQYRIVTVNEEDNGSTYSITGTEYDPRKYDVVELGLVLPERPTSAFPTGSIQPPLDLSFKAYTYFAGDTRHQGLVISWTPADDIRVNEYILDVKSPSDGGFRTVYVGTGTSYDLQDAMGGEWTIRVRSSASGIPGAWLSRVVQIAQLLMPVPPDSVEVKLGTFSITLTPRTAYPDALWEFYRSDVPLAQNLIETNAIKLPTGQYLVDTPLRSGRTYFYYVRGTNQYGKSAWFSTQGTTLMDFDDILEATKEDILNGDLYQTINAMILPIVEEEATQIAIDAATATVNAALEGIQDQIDNLVDALAYNPEDAYEIPDVVRSGKDLYQAIADVPAAPDGSNAPPNPLYWKSVGEILEDANGVVVQVQQNTTDIIKVGDKLSYTASQLTSLHAAYRDDDGNGDLEGAMDGYETKVYFNEKVTVLAEADLALSQRITDFGSEIGEVNAHLTILEQTVATGDAALSQLIINQSAALNANIAAAVQVEQTARVNADSAEATARLALAADYNGNKTTVQNTLSSLATADQTEATARLALAADYDSNKATVQTTLTALANADAAEATARQTLATDYNGNKATVQTTLNSLASADSALSSSLSTLYSTVGGNTSAIQVVQTAQASLKNGLNAMYAIKLQTHSNGAVYAAGMGIDITTVGGITQSQILFQADRFALLSTANGIVTLPFFVEGNNTFITNAMIKDASIGTAKISDAAITYAKIAFAQIGSAHIIDAQITTAKIQDLAVDTLKIAGRAVTLPVSYYSGGVLSVGGSNSAQNWSDIAVIGYNSTGQPALVNVSTQVCGNFAWPGGYWRILWNGNVWAQGRWIGTTANSSAYNGVPAASLSVNLIGTFGAQYVTLQLQMSPDLSSSATMYTDNRAMTVTEVKR